MSDDRPAAHPDSHDDVVVVTHHDRTAVVTLFRPAARNALNRQLRRRLPEVILELEADDGVDVIVLTGADPAFCAGVDLKEFGAHGSADPDRGGEAPAPKKVAGGFDIGRRDAAGRLPFRGALPPRTKLLFGAINGVAVTGGLELALACDFLVASDRARFADTHARVGVMPGWGLTVLLPQRIGLARAKEMSATGNFVDARTAYDWGLVNHVVPHDELMPFSLELAAACSTIDQRAVRRLLATYDEVAATTTDRGWDVEDRVSREWEGAGFDPAEIERRRAAVVARGRAQIGQGEPGAP